MRVVVDNFWLQSNLPKPVGSFNNMFGFAQFPTLHTVASLSFVPAPFELFPEPESTRPDSFSVRTQCQLGWDLSYPYATSRFGIVILVVCPGRLSCMADNLGPTCNNPSAEVP